jgi:hypothetical protein
MKKKNNKQLSLYRVNPENNRVVIEIAMNNYVEFFHEWDNAVFRKRDIHPELADFLDLCSEDIPIKRKLEIEFCIKNRAEDLEKEKLIVASYRNYYNSQNRLVMRNIRRLLRTSLLLFFIALGFIALHIILSTELNEHVLPRILMEGVLIGGWVFMWEALHMAIFESLDPLKRRQEFDRFLNAEIKFRTVENP